MAHILVVDDSRISRRFLTKPLREAGYEITEAGDGEEGLAAFRVSEPDCVVTDLLMPVMDGPTFLGHLREFSEVPAIVVSADIQNSTREVISQLRVKCFLNKPFVGAELLEAVSAALCEGEAVR